MKKKFLKPPHIVVKRMSQYHAAVASTGSSTARKTTLSFTAFEAYFLLKIRHHMPIFQ
jgi:hypothetical protein